MTSINKVKIVERTTFANAIDSLVNFARNISPNAAMLTFFLLFFTLSVATNVIGFSANHLPLNENQILYLFSTSAQVLAGIYGLTLTGFIFFRNELSREEFEDDTLSDAVESLKRRYFTLLVFITAFVVLTLLLSNLAISHEGYGRRNLSTLMINVAQSAFVTSLLAIGYFIFDVISPQRVASASHALQHKLDPEHKDRAKGSLEEFVGNYNMIEALLTEAGKAFQDPINSPRRGKFSRHLSNSKLAEILYRGERIDQSLYGKLRDLISLRNSIIHGAEPVVSQEKVQASSQVLDELKLALENG